VLFERFAIEVLRHTTIQAGRMILRISWDEAWHLMERAVQRGLRRKPERMIAQLGVDEKSVGSGQDYVTVVCDLKRSTVEEVTEGNNCRSLQIYFEGLTDKQREGIEAVAMDMAGGYINAVSGSLPDGREKIVFDRFHIMKLMNEAVDRVRREEHKRLTEGGSSILTGTKFLWLYARERLPTKHWEQFSSLKAAGLKTARAWAIKETLRHLWRYKSRGWAEKFWKRWYFWATHSRLEPVKKIANTLKTHLYGILTYSKHRITNATTEGINSKIETLRKAACGFRNKQRFRTLKGSGPARHREPARSGPPGIARLQPRRTGEAGGGKGDHPHPNPPPSRGREFFGVVGQVLWGDFSSTSITFKTYQRPRF
jgi:transposase